MLNHIEKQTISNNIEMMKAEGVVNTKYEYIYPDIFKRNWDKHCIELLNNEISAELEERAKQAAEDCAVAAIKIK